MLLIKLGQSSNVTDMVDLPKPRKISKVQKIAIQRNISVHELAMNILTEARYKIERQQTPVFENGWRGYLVEYPCQLNGTTFIKRMRRSWLVELADLVVEGVPAQEIAKANQTQHEWTKNVD